MADLQRANANCVSQEDFYKEVEELKSQQKTKDSKITLYLEDSFYDKAKSFLKEKIAKQLELSQNNREEPSEVSLLTKWEDATITRKQWIYKNNKVFTQDNKEVIPKRELFQVLSHAHRRIAHRGRQITTKWLRENYVEVNQKVINIFVKMCKFHAEQKSVTSHVKLVKQPMQAPTFLHMIEIDLMDFRKCPCECIESHMWAMNITDHHTKHVTLYPLTAKSG